MLIFAYQNKNRMKKKDKLSILLVLFTITGCFGAFMIINFQQGKYNIQLKITQAIQESITKDYYKRLFQDNVHTPKSLERKIKGVKITLGKNIENILFKDSIDEQIAHQLADQYILAQFTPIIPNDFNAIFKEELRKKGITDKTGIIYRHNGIPHYSDNDSISPSLAFRTHIKMLDIKNTISVQGWVDYSWGTLLKHTDAKNLWTILLFYIASLVVVLFKKKRTKNIEKPAIKENSLNYCEVGKIKLDLKKRLLYIDNVECSITNMDFDLLKMFLKAPDHYLSREDIKKAFWPKEDLVDDKINTHITSLRNKIKNLEGYSIKTIRGKGYCLDIS